MVSRLKRSNCPKWNFFSKNKIFMYLLAPFILKNFKRILRADPELSGYTMFGHKMAHLSWTIFFRYKPLPSLSSTYWPFSLCKIYKKFLQPIQSCEDAPFLDPKWSICPRKLLISFSSNYYPLSLCKISKKILPAGPALWGCAVFGPKIIHLPKLQFFQKTC